MQFFIRTVLIALLISNTIAERIFDDDNERENEDPFVRRIEQLLRKFESSDEDESSLEERYIGATQEGPCMPNILPGYLWSGHILKTEKKVKNIQDCLHHCYVNKVCTGFTYEKGSKTCITFKNIHGAKLSSVAESGSCVGSRVKVTCTENKAGRYGGVVSGTLQAGSAGDCLNSCNQAEACFGWTYATKSKTCTQFSDLTSFSKTKGYSAGTCVAPQVRHDSG